MLTLSNYNLMETAIAISAIVISAMVGTILAVHRCSEFAGLGRLMFGNAECGTHSRIQMVYDNVIPIRASLSNQIQYIVR